MQGNLGLLPSDGSGGRVPALVVQARRFWLSTFCFVTPASWLASSLTVKFRPLPVANFKSIHSVSLLLASGTIPSEWMPIW